MPEIYTYNMVLNYTGTIQFTVLAFLDSPAANLTYEIPAGVADDRFTVDPVLGVVSTRAPFDRETKDFYIVPVYVTDVSAAASGPPQSQATLRTGRSDADDATNAGQEEDDDLDLISGGSGSAARDFGKHADMFDVATIVVRVSDVNDHAPEFRPGSCYPIAVPENGDPAIVHTVVATDLDEGANGDITYSITGKRCARWKDYKQHKYNSLSLSGSGGNFGNKFSIDGRTGALTARSLDRETHGRFQLQISAQDHGAPVTYFGTCNVTVTVEDQNDNDPRFELPKYVATIGEDAAIGASVLQVRAIDADLGINARIVYSLSNETDWLFGIDNRSGLISTMG